MNIPGKLRDDLKRIYGSIDPLNCIEDVSVIGSGEDPMVQLILRVPMSCQRYAQFSSPVRDRLYDLERRVVEHAMCRCSIDDRVMQNVIEDRRTVGFVEPERVFLNGNHTTIVWPDGEKTTVGVGPDTAYDEYAGFCAAIVKRLFGSSREAQKFLDKVKIVQVRKPKKVKTGAVDSPAATVED